MYEAKAIYHQGESEWIVRLFHKNEHGTEFVGLCGANGEEEAKLIAASINGALGWKLEPCSAMVKEMFDWTRLEGKAL